ncbi:DUF4932 domain-containing protein [Qipengyuania sphaerica]|uniref:DUF4932 domain-containing protein n=1 Tax=Qipengyuania sphaerica TaxID=2867243 RepID=UPI001C88AC04|nr:DUF4932 domain-containing protein [Qipengyuania sphaerica]MBX7540268.1 DUF4932 domain-containing protein [Qipengyuania sphaerica]
MNGRIITVFAVAALAAVPATAQDFEAQSASVDLRFDGTLYPGVITLPLEEDVINVNLGAGAEPKDVCVEQAGVAECRVLTPGEPQDIAVAYAGATYVLRLQYRGQAAVFDQAYRDLHSGSVRVEVPGAYELVNVAIALTPYAEEEYGIVAPSPYLDAVRYRFSHLRDHAFVMSLDEAIREDRSSYNTLKMNGASYDLQSDDTMVRSDIYDHVGWAGNTLRPYEAEMQDFARKAQFSQFLADFAPLYAQQAAFLRDEVDISGMLDWLGREFPDVPPYDTTRVIFSPLVGANQALATFEDGGFRELQPHVNFPYPSELERFDEDLRPFLQSLIIFTELNHGFINPTSERLAPQIAAHMPDLGEWADEMPAKFYENSQGVFNEMVNWALFSVYAQDKLEPEDAQAIAQIISDTMVNGRGFLRFDAFQREFLALRAEQREGETVAKSFPQLVQSLGTFAANGDPAK